MNPDDFKDPNYLTGEHVTPALRKGRVIAILQWIHHICNDNATDEAYDVWVDTSTPEPVKLDQPQDQEESPAVINLADKFSDIADQLHDKIAELTDEAFENNTAEFKNELKKLQAAAKDVAKKLDELNAIAEKIKTIVTIVSIVDDIVEIAAGLAKSA